MDISFFKDFIRLFVGTGRFELPTLAGCASETHAYTNSATTALLNKSERVE